jgi:hypothetical protein
MTRAKKPIDRETQLTVLRDRVDAALEACNATALDSKDLPAFRETLSKALDALTEAEESP